MWLSVEFHKFFLGSFELVFCNRMGTIRRLLPKKKNRKSDHSWLPGMVIEIDQNERKQSHTKYMTGSNYWIGNCMYKWLSSSVTSRISDQLRKGMVRSLSKWMTPLFDYVGTQSWGSSGSVPQISDLTPWTASCLWRIKQISVFATIRIRAHKMLVACSYSNYGCSISE